VTDAGPYLNVDGDEFYLPAAAWSWNSARREAAFMARDADPGAASVYCGKQNIPLHDHDEPWGGNDDVCPAIPCYVFTVTDA
jgi:hypothetical protein